VPAQRVPRSTPRRSPALSLARPSAVRTPGIGPTLPTARQPGHDSTATHRTATTALPLPSTTDQQSPPKGTPVTPSLWIALILGPRSLRAPLPRPAVPLPLSSLAPRHSEPDKRSETLRALPPAPHGPPRHRPAVRRVGR